MTDIVARPEVVFGLGVVDTVIAAIKIRYMMTPMLIIRLAVEWVWLQHLQYESYLYQDSEYLNKLFVLTNILHR